jgi:hypothetical protein
MSRNHWQLIKSLARIMGLMIASAFICLGSFLNLDNQALALDQTAGKAIVGAGAASKSINPQPVLVYINALGAFDNAPKGDKIQLKAKYQDLQRLAPGFLATAKAVVKEHKAKGQWAAIDQFLYAEAAKDGLPAQLMAEVKSLGGPSVILENLDRFAAEDLKNRGQRIAESKQGSIFNGFGFIGTAHAGTGCSIGAWGANGVMKVFGWLTKKSYSADIEAANLKYCH